MDKDFRDDVTERLKQVPLEARRRWTETDLFRWWLVARTSDPDLTGGHTVDDEWEQIRHLCSDLIGPHA